MLGFTMKDPSANSIKMTPPYPFSDTSKDNILISTL